MSDNMFIADFSQIEAPTSNYVEPGHYRMKVSKIELGDFKGKNSTVSKKTLKISFTSKDEKTYTETFYLQGDTSDKTKKALGRLQYLHEAVFGERMNESFSTYEEMEAYFKKKFTPAKNPPVINLIVSGEEQEDGKVYSRLGFANFIFSGNDKDFVEEVFEKGSPSYKAVVTKKKSTPAGMGVFGTSAPVLNAVSGQAAAAPWDQD